MKSIKEIMDGPEISNYSGSERTASLIAKQISERWSKSELKNYDPLRNTLTFRKWLTLGFVPRKGEKALKSFTVSEVKDSNGNVIKTITRPIYLFYYRQVETLRKNHE